MSPFNDPSEFAQPTAMFSAASCDHRFDVAFAQSSTMRIAIVTTIGIDDLGSPKWSTARAADRGNRVDERHQLGDVVAVRAAQDGADERSICPASRNFSSSSSCSRSHTPALRQSFSRRQQVAPDPKPNRVGRWFHRRPVSNTNRMPFNAARSDMRGRPGSSLCRGLGSGSNGSISVHNSSSMMRAIVPWVPLF